MKHIWWGNTRSIEQLNKGYKTISIWWFLTLLSMVLSRIAAGKYNQAVYADDFLTATYLYIFQYVVSIHFLIMTLKLITNINKMEIANSSDRIITNR